MIEDKTKVEIALSGSQITVLDDLAASRDMSVDQLLNILINEFLFREQLRAYNEHESRKNK